jgi:hypothetical protein
MRCEDASEWFGKYRDLPEGSELRLAIDRHIEECGTCAEEFFLWEESALLINEMSAEDIGMDDTTSHLVSQNVMNRIYSEQSWLMPASRRTYFFTGAFRRKVAGVLAALLAVFIVGFLYTSFGRAQGPDQQLAGVMDTANAFAASHELNSGIHLEVPVASLSDPIMLQVSPSMPEYWVAFSMLGILMTLLILNWFSRVRA